MKIKCVCKHCRSKEYKINKFLRIKWVDKPENCISLEISNEKGIFDFPRIIMNVDDLHKIFKELKKEKGV